MKPQTFILHDEIHQRHMLRHIGHMALAGITPEVVVRPYDRKRNSDQNALIYALYAEIGEQMDGENTQTIKRECKLIHGVPILKADDPEFREKYDRTVEPIDHENKLIIMDWFPVTSLMKTAQASRYIDAIIRDYTRRGCRITTRDYD